MASVEELFKKHGLKIDIKPKYNLYTYDQIINEVEKACQDASEVLEFSTENCKILLYHFKWNLLNLTEKFFDASSAKEFIKKSGIKYILDDSLKDDTVTVDQCKICNELKDVAILSCSHLFCFDCWKSIARTAKDKLKDKNVLPYLTCDFEGCKAPVPEIFTLQLFRDPDTYHFYQHMIIQSFIQSNPFFKWCPNKSNGCTLAVKIENSEVEEITCECGFTYCFNCKDLPHFPFPCILIRKWKHELEIRDTRGGSDFVMCPNCYEHVFARNNYGTVSCSSCKATVDIGKELASKPFMTKSTNVEDFKAQNELLKKEFEELALLEKVEDGSVDFLKTALKFLHNFRQKFLYFYAFSYFLENRQIFTKFQSELQILLNKAKNLLYIPFGPKHSRRIEAPYFSKEKEMEVIEILIQIQNQLEAQIKSFYEDDWKFRDKDIEKAMRECKY